MAELQLIRGFCSILRNALIENEMSQNELADETGLARSTVSRYIRGQRVPTYDNLDRIASVLDLDIDELIDNDYYDYQYENPRPVYSQEGGYYMTELELIKEFGDNLRDVLIEYKMSQLELSEVTGLTQGAISMYVHGQIMPTVKNLINIAYVLDLDIDELMDFDYFVH